MVLGGAALPWLTGTSINPLLRAAYLVKEDASRSVTLVSTPLTPFAAQKVSGGGELYVHSALT